VPGCPRADRLIRAAAAGVLERCYHAQAAVCAEGYEVRSASRVASLPQVAGAAVGREPGPSGGPAADGSLGPSVTRRLCARDESARNAGETRGCGTADGAARHTLGTQTRSPPVPAGPGCRRPACGAPAERAASPALAAPARTPNAGTQVRTHRTGSPAPTPARCRAAAVRAAGCSMRSYVHDRAAVSAAGTTR
jgi:hypothetical protein